MKIPTALLAGFGVIMAPFTGHVMTDLLPSPPHLPFDASMMIALLGITLIGFGGFQMVNHRVVAVPTKR